MSAGLAAVLVLSTSSSAAAHVRPPTPDQWPIVLSETVSAPETITRGVRWYTDTLHTVAGGQRAQVLEVDLGDPNVRLGVVESHDRLTDPAGEVPSSMAERTGAVAGVNGDFFDIFRSGRPHGMVVRDGRLVKSPNPRWTADLWVRLDGSIGIGTETYSGAVTDVTPGASRPATHAITSVNTVEDLASGALVRVTADLGARVSLPASAVVVSGRTDPLSPGSWRVKSVRTGVTRLPHLDADTQELVGSGSSGRWLARTVRTGDRLRVNEHLGPDDTVAQAISGGAVLVRDGARAVPLHGSGDNNVANPITAVGVTRDGRHAVFVAFDGRKPHVIAAGLTRPQIAGWMLAHGAYQAILFDGGGSTDMVARLPGARQAAVLNQPSDGHQRPVANGLFVYHTGRRDAVVER